MKNSVDPVQMASSENSTQKYSSSLKERPETCSAG